MPILTRWSAGLSPAASTTEPIEQMTPGSEGFQPAGCLIEVSDHSSWSTSSQLPLRSPVGAPLSRTPPCNATHRLLSRTIGDRRGAPERALYARAHAKARAGGTAADPITGSEARPEHTRVIDWPVNTRKMRRATIHHAA